MYKKLAPMFLVDDVDKAVSFYQEVFGTRLRHSLPDAPPFEWVSILLEDMEIMFWKKEAAQKEYPDVSVTSEEPGNLIVYVYVEDVDQLYERVKDKVTVLMEPKDQFYGIREFTIRDCFGFIWTFAEIRVEGRSEGQAFAQK
jgi:uncharacterized glyoxalase superfamily protein PhnB